jgi:hypothetical protein
MNTHPINLTLTATQVQTVLQALANLPWAQVDALLREIQQQADAQLAPKPAPAPAPAPAAASKAGLSTMGGGGPGPRKQ